MSKRYGIGLATTFHDPALAIVDPDGEIVFAEATERFLQYKRAFNCEPDPLFRIGELLRRYCDPDAEFAIGTTWTGRASRLPVWLALVQACGGLRPGWLTRALPDRLSPVLLLKQYQLYHMLLCVQSSHLKAGANLALALRDWLGPRIVRQHRYEHHLTHAVMACHSSPFAEAVCLIVDGTGDYGSVSCFRYVDGLVRPVHRHRGNGSLGAVFMLVTQLCGFSSFQGEEWKVMGLAPYGSYDPSINALLSKLLHVDGLDLHQPPAGQLRKHLTALERYQRKPGSAPQTVADLACTWQKVFSDFMTQLINNVHALDLSQNLVLAGGCALNSSYMGRVLSQTGFRRLHVPSAPADDGAAVGAALLAQAGSGTVTVRDRPHSPYLGSDLDEDALARLARYGAGGKVTHLPEEIIAVTAQALAEGKIVGWVQGRAEFGPRALGNRSILADPRAPEMKDRLNATVKFREEYRPFAPAILHEHGPKYFLDYQESPYMERTLRFRPEVIARVPAVVHVDGTGRLQTVRPESNPRFHALLAEFYALTRVPILLNTSFNVMGKPIIHGIEDAIAVFYTSGIDLLVIGDYLIEK